MKPSAFLINTARGGLVNEADLAEALRGKRIAGAAIDVFEQEPPDKKHAFFALDNVVLTPHIGWPTDHGYQRFAAAACEVLLAYMDGREFPTFEQH
jgi:phosphoglycerate dehydrogenase-like enzyme